MATVIVVLETSNIPSKNPIVFGKAADVQAVSWTVKTDQKCFREAKEQHN